jgi:hypothetical protein
VIRSYVWSAARRAWAIRNREGRGLNALPHATHRSAEADVTWRSRSHLTNIFHKIDVSSRTQAARYAIDRGLAAAR